MISDTKVFQPYQDAENGAAITLSCTGGGRVCQTQLVGSYFHGENFYHIEPAPVKDRLKRDVPSGVARHHVYRRASPEIDKESIRPDQVTVEITPVAKKRKRLRRQDTQTYIVEILLVLDYEIYKRFYESVPKETIRKREEVYTKLKQYYFHVFNAMDMRYSYISATDYRIRIRLSDFIIAEEKRFSPWTENYVRNGTVDVTDVLKPFAETKERIQMKYKLSPFDHAMAMSGYDLIFENKRSTLGYAYLNTTCQYWSVSFVEDRNDIMKTVWTAAHELGHSLCALHDGYQNNCKSYRKYIMTSTIDKPSLLTRENPWKFSQCSINYFREMLAKLNRQPKNCLQDTSPPNFFGKENWNQHTSSHFGTIYNPDEQCQRIHGRTSYMCRDELPEASRICINLRCHRIDPVTGESDCTPHLAATGTTCGHKQWCYRGRCVFNQAAQPVDECPFGDQPGAVAGGSSCQDAVRRNHDLCRVKEFKLQCCRACRNTSTVSLRINRGTMTEPVVDKYFVGNTVSRELSVDSNSIPSMRTTLDLQSSTTSPSNSVIYQAPPLIQPQPDPQTPPAVSPTQTSQRTPSATGCQDSRSPLNQSVVNCQGFNTFCYLDRIKRDCCATCQLAKLSPAGFIHPDQTRKRRAALKILLRRFRRGISKTEQGILHSVLTGTPFTSTTTSTTSLRTSQQPSFTTASTTQVQETDRRNNGSALITIDVSYIPPSRRDIGSSLGDTTRNPSSVPDRTTLPSTHTAYQKTEAAAVDISEGLFIDPLQEPPASV